LSKLTYHSSPRDLIAEQVGKFIDTKQFHSIEWQLDQSGNVLSSGFESIETDAPAIKNPIYRIYSMTKPMVSFVAMQLIQENRLSLTDSVAMYIPAFANLEVLSGDGSLESLQTDITIEHLLTHTAGFSYDFLPDCKVAERYRDVQLCGNASRSLTETIGLLTTMPLAYQPGSEWRYSVATDVLAHVLENVTGLTLPDLLAERILKPLEMNDTAFSVSDDSVDRLLPIFGARDLGQVMTESTEPNELIPVDVTESYPIDSAEFYRGGHGLYSTLADYQKFMHVLKTGSTASGEAMLFPNTFDTMWGNHVSESLMPLTIGFNPMHGYGWNYVGRLMHDLPKSVLRSYSGEGGWSGAASTYFWIDRENDITGIVMAQYIGSTAQLGPMMQHAAYGMFKA